MVALNKVFSNCFYFRIWKRKNDAVPTIFDSSQSEKACGPPKDGCDGNSQQRPRSKYLEERERIRVSMTI
jgi:hypothetical protein